MTMTTRQDIIDAARGWRDTPYRHQGRLKGIAVDCVGLVLGVCKELELECADVSGYSSRPDGTPLPELQRQTLEVAPGQQRPGDLAVFHWEQAALHVGILTGPDVVIHAFALARKVTEHRLDAKWLHHVTCYRAFKGVE